MRLWELEGGDGGDVGIGYGGNAARQANAQAVQYGQHLERVRERLVVDDLHEEAEEDEEMPEVLPEQQPRPEPGQPQPPRDQPNGRVAIAREGPLVLRIEGGAAPARARVEQRRQPAAADHHGEINVGQRGGRGNRRGRGPGLNRQNNRNRAQGQNQQVNNNGRNGQIRMGDGDGEVLRGDGQLDARQEAWIRQFVQLALNDQEDLVEWDSDDD